MSDEKPKQRERFGSGSNGFTAEVACEKCNAIVVFLNPSIEDWYHPLCLRCYRNQQEHPDGCDEIGTEVSR